MALDECIEHRKADLLHLLPEVAFNLVDAPIVAGSSSDQVSHLIQLVLRLENLSFLCHDHVRASLPKGETFFTTTNVLPRSPLLRHYYRT